MISQVFYISSSHFSPNNPIDKDILRVARKNNSRLGLTGCLFRSDRYYAQLLEGPEESVWRMMRRIRRDLRHFDIKEWPLTQAPVRTFPDWHMGYSIAEVADYQLKAIGQAEARPIREISENLKLLFEANFEHAP